MSTVAERYFTATDERLRNVEPTWWGAVVTDERFPDVYDLNYARVSTSSPDLSLDDVVQELEPALRRTRSRHVQIVVLATDGAPRLVEQATAAGLRLSSDTVMELRRPTPPPEHGGDLPPVEEADPGAPEFADLLRRAYAEFEVTQEHVVEQLLRWNREVLAPSGRRYFVVRVEGEVAGTGAFHLAGGVAYVDDIVTFSEYRRRGVASAIVRRLIREAGEVDTESTFLLADQLGPMRLYRSLGFEETGRVHGLLGGIDQVAAPGGTRVPG
jgi:N-acetylglutamate synthase-like GNAT family acetyltransferase